MYHSITVFGIINTVTVEVQNGAKYLKVLVDVVEKDKTVQYSCIFLDNLIKNPEAFLEELNVGAAIQVRGSPRARIADHESVQHGIFATEYPVVTGSHKLQLIGTITKAVQDVSPVSQKEYLRVTVCVKPFTEQGKEYFYVVFINNDILPNPSKILPHLHTGREVQLVGKPHHKIMEIEEGVKSVQLGLVATEFPILLGKRY